MDKIEEYTPENGDPIKDLFFFKEGTSQVGFVHLSESKGKRPKGTLGVVEGVAGKAGIVNRNGRFYSETVYALATERAQGLVEDGRFLGEVDHPFQGSLHGAAYRFTKLYMEGDLMKFEGVILDTPGGRVLKGLLEGGVGVAVSTRGYGSIKFEKMDVDGDEKEVGVIQDDYRMEGIDFVLFPSNPSGEVTHHENTTRTQQENRMDLEELRQEYPELVAEIEAAAREGYISEEEVEARVEEAVEAQIEDARAEARDEVLEGEEVTALRSLRDAVVEALRPHVPELAKEADKAEKTETERELEALRTQVDELTEGLSEVQAERDQLQSEQDEADRREAVAAKVDEVTADFAHADLIRDELLTCESADEVEAAFEAKRGLVESLAARLGVKTDEAGRGEGNAETEDLDEVDETSEEVAEEVEKRRQRALAGLDS